MTALTNQAVSLKGAQKGLRERDLWEPMVPAPLNSDRFL